MCGLEDGAVPGLLGREERQRSEEELWEMNEADNARVSLLCALTAVNTVNSWLNKRTSEWSTVAC